jgi:hypothetical protein
MFDAKTLFEFLSLKCIGNCPYYGICIEILFDYKVNMMIWFKALVVLIYNCENPKGSDPILLIAFCHQDYSFFKCLQQGID